MSRRSGRRMCSECGERKAIYWRSGWRKMGSSPDHPLCRECRKRELDRYRARRLRAEDEGGVSMDDLEFLNRVREFVYGVGIAPLVGTAGEVDEWRRARRREREVLLVELDARIARVAGVPQADGDSGR